MKAEYIDHMGTDLSVVDAARVSFAKESDWVPSGAPNDYDGVVYQVINGQCVNLSQADARLINYLAKHNHWTPFGHCVVKLRMSAPVPIRTQCFKHKQGFVENEESRRYISSKPELFIPEFFRSRPEGSVKQGSSGAHPNQNWMKVYKTYCGACIEKYLEMIEDGVCPEQARFILPQGVEVNWVWTGSLFAFANFYNKRTDNHAQKEIQDLAESVGQIIEKLYPVSWAALTRQEVSTND